MQHKLTGAQPKRINIEKGVFESCGIFYFINVEAAGYARLKRYAELLPVITYGRKFTEFAQMVHNLRMKMLQSEDPLKQVYFEVLLELTNWDQYLLDNSGTFYDNAVDDTLRFCALFCVTKDEDMTMIDEIHMEQKISNWQKDMHIPDFFSLGKQFAPRYKDLLLTIWEEAKTKGGSLTESQSIPEN